MAKRSDFVVIWISDVPFSDVDCKRKKYLSKEFPRLAFGFWINPVQFKNTKFLSEIETLMRSDFGVIRISVIHCTYTVTRQKI